MQRVKNVSYDEDELYSDEEQDYTANDNETNQESYSSEDLQNFAELTPVVRAELAEAGLQASDREIEDALWHYYWDVGKSVAYLKNVRTPRQNKQEGKKGEGAKGKAKSKFDQAVERSSQKTASGGRSTAFVFSGRDWFKDVSWSSLPLDIRGELVPALPMPPPPKLLGGSSKLAKLAEERRKKAALATASPSPEVPNGSLSSLDRLGKPKNTKENVPPPTATAPRKYPSRPKREPTPPPREPTPEPEEPKEELPDLRAPPTAFGQTLSRSLPNVGISNNEALTDLMRSMSVEDPFTGPSPDDTVMRTETPKSTKQKSATLSKQTEALKLDDQQAVASPQPKSKAKLVDVAKLWADSKATRRSSAAFVVIGHVDHGKSTLMGRLLLDTGAVGQRDIDKYQKEASTMNKASFALAWVLDTGTEERARGVTVDIASHPFSTTTTDFVILDAPGHRDFVPNMLAGAAMADLAVLVVDARQLESGMSVRGQTREHVLLAWAMGVRKVIVAVNKMDGTVNTGGGEWDEELFNKVRQEVGKFLIETGFTKEDVTFVPLSGLTGTNVVKPPAAAKPTSWVSRASPPLLAVLEKAASSLPEPTETLIKAPPHLQISSLAPSPLTITGRLSSGSLQPNQPLLILPSSTPTTLRSIEISTVSSQEQSGSRDYAIPGDIVTLHLSGTDPEAIPHLRPGDVVCSPSDPVPVVKNFVAQITALDAILPMGVDVHFGRLHVGGSVKTLISVVEGSGEDVVVKKRKPRVVRAGEKAVVRVETERAVPVEVGGRVVLRVGGDTVGAGVVVRGVGGKAS